MKIIQTKYSTRDGGHYSPVVEYGGTLYISGQLSIDPETGKPPEGLRAQAAQSLKNLETALAAGGAGREDVIMCRVYLPDVSYWSEFNQVYSEFFGEHKPARMVVPTNQLYGGCLTEVEAVAQIKK